VWDGLGTKHGEQVTNFIISLRKSLHCDWLKAGQFIVNSEFAEFAVEINTRAYENFSVTYEMSNRAKARAIKDYTTRGI